VVIPESAAPQFKGGGLTLETHARLFTYRTPDGDEHARALTSFWSIVAHCPIVSMRT